MPLAPGAGSTFATFSDPGFGKPRSEKQIGVNDRKARMMEEILDRLENGAGWDRHYYEEYWQGYRQALKDVREQIEINGT